MPGQQLLKQQQHWCAPCRLCRIQLGHYQPRTHSGNDLRMQTKLRSRNCENSGFCATTCRRQGASVLLLQIYCSLHALQTAIGPTARSDGLSLQKG